MRFQNQRCSGFTLLEVLVAVTIFGIIIVTVFSVFSIGLKSYKKGIGKGDVMQEVRGGLKLIEADIENMLPPSFGVEVFEPGNMKFIVANDAEKKLLKMINYEIIDDKISRKFIVFPYQNAYSDAVVIIRGIQNASFNYISGDENSSTEGYPDGVSVNLKLKINQEEGNFKSTFMFPLSKNLEKEENAKK